MKFLMLLSIVAGLVIAPSPLTQAAPPKTVPLKEKLVGTWLELGKTDNLFILKADGSYRILLKRSEIENVHSLDGTWTLEKMTIMFAVKYLGQTTTTAAKVSVAGEEMVLTNEGGPTNHRRIKGPVPERFTW